MADVTIEAACPAGGMMYTGSARGGIFWTSATVGYMIYIDSNTDLVYRKTADGGDTWGASVQISTGHVLAYDCYADWDVPGDAGTVIHIAYIDATPDDVMYAWLDTSDDSKGTDSVEAAQGDGTISGSVGRGYHIISITKSVGDTIMVAGHYTDNSAATFSFCYTSPDGNNWTSATSPQETTGDFILLFPANLADTDDLWCMYWDVSANQVSIKTYDDSADDWTSELAEQVVCTAVEQNNYLQMMGAIRHSDGELLGGVWNSLDLATSDLETFEFDGANVVAKTNVITNTQEYMGVGITINQTTDDVYIAYLGGTAWAAQIKCYYKKSDDGMATWGGQQAMQADAEDDERAVFLGPVKAAWGGNMMPVWYNHDLFDLFCNTDNAVAISTGTAHVKNLADTVTITDTIRKVFTGNKSDTFALADAISKATTKPQADTVALADTISKAPGKVVADNVALADAMTKTIGLNKSDTVTLADTLAKVVTVVKADTVAIADAISKAPGLIKADVIAIVDSVVKTVTLVKADVMVITDSIDSPSFVRRGIALVVKIFNRIFSTKVKDVTLTTKVHDIDLTVKTKDTL